MLTPEGHSGDDTDKVMLQAMWASTIKTEAGDHPVKPLISAGMGKPTFPINIHTVEINLAYWRAIEALLKKAAVEKVTPLDEKVRPATVINLVKSIAFALSAKAFALATPSSSSSSSSSSKAIVTESLALDYGDGRGDIEPRQMMAKAMTDWYGSPVSSDNILFTVGGAGALRIIFETFNLMYHDIPKYRVITPFPHYSLYADNRHQLHPIDVMNEPGYQLTAKALEASIDSANALAEEDNNVPKVLLLCNPSNPLGTVISEIELLKIAEVLKKHPKINIVIDEAYAEMYWQGDKVPSLLALAPELKERVIILRSATKALSSAGERMAMLMAFDPKLMTLLRNKNISTIGHAPRSAQVSYAYTMKQFGSKEQKALQEYYQPKVEYVYKRAQEMGASMPDPLYKVAGTFYVLCDLSDLLGTKIPQEAKRALDKSGDTILTSEELAYSLLFKEALMISPGSYFGMPKENGFMRITCSGTDAELKEMMDRLENCLKTARLEKRAQLTVEIDSKMFQLTDETMRKKALAQLSAVTPLTPTTTSLQLKIHNKQLTELLSTVNLSLSRPAAESKKKAALLIYSFLNSANPPVNEHKLENDLHILWRKFIKDTCSDGPLKNYLLNLNDKDKKSFKPWTAYLAEEQEKKKENKENKEIKEIKEIKEKIHTEKSQNIVTVDKLDVDKVVDTMIDRIDRIDRLQKIDEGSGRLLPRNITDIIASYAEENASKPKRS